MVKKILSISLLLASFSGGNVFAQDAFQIQKECRCSCYNTRYGDVEWTEVDDSVTSKSECEDQGNGVDCFLYDGKADIGELYCRWAKPRPKKKGEDKKLLEDLHSLSTSELQGLLR